MKKRVYIAGPMRGYPELNFPMFFKYEEVWKDKGWVVVNPAQMDLDDGYNPYEDKDIEVNGISFTEAMARDLPAVASCHAIALLPGWEASVGANTELKHALSLGRDVYDAVSGCVVDYQPVLDV